MLIAACRLDCVAQFINNAASGCDNGYWYAFPTSPMGQSAAIHAHDAWLQSLRTQPLLKHANNTAHGCENGVVCDVVRG